LLPLALFTLAYGRDGSPRGQNRKCTPCDRGAARHFRRFSKILHPADCSRIAKMVVTEKPKPVKDDAVTKNLSAIVAAFGAASK
jgi:hypothetical protein